MQGVKGDQGIQGPTGLQGPAGIQGVKGDQGIQGATGLQGPAGFGSGGGGSTGPTGPAVSLSPLPFIAVSGNTSGTVHDANTNVKFNEVAFNINTDLSDSAVLNTTTYKIKVPATGTYAVEFHAFVNNAWNADVRLQFCGSSNLFENRLVCSALPTTTGQIGGTGIYRLTKNDEVFVLVNSKITLFFAGLYHTRLVLQCLSLGLSSPTGPTGPAGVTGPATSYIFDGGVPSSSYSNGPAFDCGDPSAGSNIQLQLRRGTTSAWLSANPVLASGEPVFDTSSQQLKVGNGTSTWTNLRNLNGLTVGGNALNPSHTFITDLSSGMFSPATNTVGFATLGVERMRVDTNGNVGIGIANSGSNILTVRKEEAFADRAATIIPSQLSIEGTGGAKLKLGTFYTGGVGFTSVIQSADFYSLADNGGMLLLNPRGGNVGIGNTDATFRLHLGVDSAAKPSTNTWTISSDRRIKTDIEDADTQVCYDVVKQLKLKRFQYDASYAEVTQMKDKHMVGWIAQDVETVFPKAVTITPYDSVANLSNFYGLDVDQLYKSMYGALQKVIEDKEALETKLQAFEARLAAVETRES